MNTHTNKNKPVKARANYGPTPVLIVSSADSKAHIRQAIKTAEAGQVVIVEPVRSEIPERAKGLCEQIRAAKTVDEVFSLLARGVNYTQSSPKTQRRWRSLAKRRLQALGIEPAKLATFNQVLS